MKPTHPSEQHGNIIKVGHIDDEDLQRNISISYEIVVPPATRLRSSSGSGEEDISGISGPVEVSSGSGSLKLANIGDTVRVSTGSGHISVEGVKGTVHASTGSGEIHAMDVAGALHASTGSGSVSLRQTASGEVEVSTGSGTVQLAGVHGHRARLNGQRQHLCRRRGRGLMAPLCRFRQRRRALAQPEGIYAARATVSGSIHTAREMTVRARLAGVSWTGRSVEAVSCWM